MLVRDRIKFRCSRRTKVCVGCGEMSLICLGGVKNRWEFFINGEGYRQSTDGVDLSKTDDVNIKKLEKLKKAVLEIDGSQSKITIESGKYRFMAYDLNTFKLSVKDLVFKYHGSFVLAHSGLIMQYISRLRGIYCYLNHSRCVLFSPRW